MTTENGDGQTDVDFLLNVLFDHNMFWIQQFLKDKGLFAKGNKWNSATVLSPTLKTAPSPQRTLSICLMKSRVGGISTFIFTRFRCFDCQFV